MLKRVIGALVGREMDRRDGSGGMKGAALGWAAGSVLRRMGPFGTALGAAYVGKKLYERRKASKRRPL
ncbi:hypothetical protein [Sphingomonas baiyangensis]|uniref:Uncharacterized protein n=1 Tax=Sphingomonas baiyangensis TaxID=2572576 RepID=A0A4U1L940_9SPHN|nr:hypothetical protein [Sphingomonas baiyangensis]TKD52826.1 hypothetical protein FBR43_00220 [Sphingomonas baiyangensis]